MSRITHRPLPITWRDLPEKDIPVLYPVISRVLDSWLGTPYAAGQHIKGIATDCVRFVAAVLDELNGRTPQDLTRLRLPSDLGMHNRREAMRGLKLFRRIFIPNARVRDRVVEPGDALIVGPPGGGPTHAKFAGTRRNTFYHATIDGVAICGNMEPVGTRFAIIRPLNKSEWQGAV